jgi:membrane protease YdiL (CAAX protease family)
MAVFGSDFRAARGHWLYRAYSEQSIGSAIGFFLFYLFLQMLLPILPMIAHGIGVRLGQPIFSSQSTQFVAIMFAMVPAALLVSWLIHRTGITRGGIGISADLLRFPKLGWGGWIALVIGFVVTLGLFAAMLRLALGDVSTTGGVEQETNKVRDVAAARFIIPIAVGLCAPIAEEFLFRGPLFVRLKQTSLGAAGTVLLTSAIWASIHVTQPWINIAVLFFMGLVLGTLLLRFGSIWVPVVCHCAWNTMAAMTLLNVDLDMLK